MDFSADTLFAWLQQSAGDPLTLGIALAIATFVTEDGALVAGSLLVGAGLASPLFTILALAIGITAGDVGLYAAGSWARSNKFLRKRLPVRKSRPLRRWLQGKESMVLFFSRFTPGARLVTYVTFGFLKLSLARFVIVMTVASAIWVTAMVLFTSEIQQALSEYGSWVGAVAAIAITFTIVLIFRHFLKKSGLAPDIEHAVDPATGQEIKETAPKHPYNDTKAK